MFENLYWIGGVVVVCLAFALMIAHEARAERRHRETLARILAPEDKPMKPEPGRCSCPSCTASEYADAAGIKTLQDAFHRNITIDDVRRRAREAEGGL